MNRIRDFLRNHIRLLFIAVIVIVVAAAFVLVRLIVFGMQYKGTEVIAEKDNAGESLSHYEVISGKVIRYSSDGVALLDGDLGKNWNQSHLLNSPSAAAENGYLLLFDKQGTGTALFNTKGAVSDFRTDAPIVAAAVSENGNVALTLDNGTDAFVRYYAKDGSAIADIAGGWDDLGYPVAMDLSPDGYHIGVAYLRADEEGISSRLCIYNFSNDRHDSGENLVCDETFQGDVIPCVVAGNKYLDVICEKGFYIYRLGNDVRKENTVTFDQDIVSVFYDTDYLGFVFRSMEEGGRYTVKIFNINGTERCTFELSMIYEKIAFMEGDIVAYNSSEMEVYNLSGKKKFSGVFPAGGVEEIHRIARNRYLTVTNRKIEIVKLKLLDRD